MKFTIYFEDNSIKELPKGTTMEEAKHIANISGKRWLWIEVRIG